jgi:hypothetical protein
MRNKALFLELMPIGRLHAAAQICAGPLEGPSVTIRPLLMGRRILIGKYAFGREVRQLFIAGIT